MEMDLDNIKMVETPEVPKKKTMTFKNRYDTDPAFKKRHLAYTNSRILCEVCGKSYTRSNSKKHTSTARHISAQVEKVKNDELEKQQRELRESTQNGKLIKEIKAKHAEIDELMKRFTS